MNYFLYPVRERKATAARAYVFLHTILVFHSQSSQQKVTHKNNAVAVVQRTRAHWFASKYNGQR
jgi:hypothetical protein